MEKGSPRFCESSMAQKKISGERSEGHNVIKAFYAQHQLEALTLDNEIIQEMVQAGSNKTETELRNVLGCFLFSSEDVFKKIKVLSGGEKSRVALAKTLISEANFLLLDEPTNHLDFQSVNILIQALQQYEGTFITVSHDRHFIRGVANKIWYIEDHQIKEYPGSYEEYEFWKSQQDEVEKQEEKTAPKKEKVKAPIANSELNEAKKSLRKLEYELEQVEKELERWEEKSKSLEEKLADPKLYEDLESAEKVQKEFEEVKSQLDKSNSSWEKLVEEISKLQEVIS